MSEAELYPHVRDWIDAEFPPTRKGAYLESHRKTLVTANLDWIDGGMWTRPDLAHVHVHRRRFESYPVLDLFTFEVKPPGTRALAGLHQTLAHGRIADFVVFVLPDQDDNSGEIEAQASRFGVGLVTFQNSKIWSTYKMRVPPQRMLPDPDLRDLFLTRALESEGSTREVLDWLRGRGSE